MNYFKEALKRGAMGIAIGAFIGQTIFCIEAFKLGINGTVEVRPIVYDFFISSVLGFFMAAVSVVFNIEGWSALKKTIVHFIIMGSVFFTASALGNWMPEEFGAKIGYAVTFVLIYVFIWFSYKAYWKAKIRDVNAKIENKN